VSHESAGPLLSASSTAAASEPGAGPAGSATTVSAVNPAALSSCATRPISLGAGVVVSRSSISPRSQIREDPLVVRRLLRRTDTGIPTYLRELNAVGRAAAKIAIASTDDELLAEERTMLQVIGNELEDVLVEPGYLEAPSPTEAAVRAVAAVAERHRSEQRRGIDELTARFGEGPSLSQVRTMLDGGELLDTGTVDGLSGRARADCEAMGEQEQRRAAYEWWREHAAAQRVRRTVLLKQLAHSREEFYAVIDDQHLRTCSRCHEVVYPTLDATATGKPTRVPCPYCDRPTRQNPGEHDPLGPPPTCQTRRTTCETRTTRPL
jgi:hypothetical protein